MEPNCNDKLIATNGVQSKQCLMFSENGNQQQQLDHVQNVDSSVSCSFDSSTDTIRVINGFEKGLAAGTHFQFVIDSLRNPLSFQSISIQIQTMTSDNLGIIERGQASLTASQPAMISASSVTTQADDTTVQELTNFRVEFVNPVPLSAGTIVTVVFPQQFSFDSKLSIVQGFGLFGTIKNLEFTADDSQRSVKITNGIDSYKAAGVRGILIFQQVKNPSYVKETDSFTIHLTDSNGYQIAQVLTGITFMPTKGEINNVGLSAETLTVNSRTDLTLSFAPKHSLSSNSVLNIIMPSNLEINCDGFKTSGGFSQGMLCTESSANNFTFTNVFSSTYSYAEGNTLKITFTNVLNPPSAQDIMGLIINTYEKAAAVGGHQNFLVDQYSTTDVVLYQIQPSQFLSQSVEVNTNQTYTPATFTFTLVLDNPTPINGKVKVVIPDEVSIVGIISCVGIQNIAVELTCTQDGQSIIITNGFIDGEVAKGQTIKFSIDGLRTSLSTKTSSSFQIYTMDPNDYAIDQTTALLTITMLKGMDITSLLVRTSSNTVADQTELTVTLKPPVPLIDQHQLFIILPDDVGAPSKSNLRCSGADSLRSSLSCEVNGQTVIATVSLRSSPSIPNSSVITVKFRYAQNPSSTKPSREFHVSIRDQYGYVISETVDDNQGYIKVGIPSPVTNANLTALDKRQHAFTTITVTFIPNNLIPRDGYLEVTFPRIFFQITQDETTKCTSNLIKNDNVSCEFMTSGSFRVKNIFPRDFAPGQLVDFTINNVLLDINDKGKTDSWTVISYTPDGYMIDRVRDVLTLDFPCNAPCLTCPSNNPNYCLSCNSATNNTILYNNKCMATCPDSLYYDMIDQICKPCNSTCRTCSFDNPNECTSCDVYSDFPYLDGTTCTTGCGFGFFANNRTARCEKCSSSCLSCEGSPTNCITCDETSKSKYLHINRCVSSCPTGFTTTLDSNNECLKCDDNCQDCVGSTSQCTSCKSPLLLSEYDSSCVSECPNGKTIYNSKTKVCEACDAKCKSCSGKKDFCTSCAENLNLWPATGQCIGECSADRKWVGYNGICTQCDSTCLTCISKPDSCLSCVTGQYLYDYSCVGQCPPGYEPNEDNQCVINGLRCPFGYEPNPQGNACVLKSQICKDGFTLNKAKDRCIPGPGTYVPFPLCFACLFLTLIILVSWVKYKQTLISSNVIAAMSMVKTIGLLMQIILAYEMGVYSTFGLSLTAAFFLYGSNLFFSALFLKNVSNDSAFKHWRLSYRITYGTVVLLGSGVNFKVFRVIYGRFFNLDNFNAPFDEPQQFFKPFTFISVFSLVTTMLPILVANIVGLVFIDFGYQVQMCCIELTIIELVMLALMIYENIKLKKKLIKQQQYYKIEPKLLDNSQVNVMSSLFDHEYSIKPTIGTQSMKGGVGGGGLTLKTEDNLLSTTMNWVEERQKLKNRPAEFQEYYERRRMLERLISQMYSKDATMIGRNDTTIDLITKLQEEEMMRMQERNCKSFRYLRENDEDFADQNAADPELQNFISAPVSPREKEMLHNPFFMGKVGEFKKVLRQRDQYDNCYAEGKPAHYFPMRDTKLVTVKVQTNLHELLAFDDQEPMERPSRLTFQQHDFSEEEYVEENLHEDYTQGLIDNVLDNFKDHQFKKQRRRLPKARLAQIPNFDLSDITGDFEIDDNGNHIIIRGKDGKLNDREGRKVNSNGYLVDNEGNVITKRGVLVFRVDELDSDGEIPAPFCFEKKMENLFKIEGIKAITNKTQKKNIIDNDEEVEREYRLLKEKNASLNQSSVDSLIGETPSKYNKKNKRVIPGDEDGFLSKIVQPMRAKTKEELMGLSTNANDGNKSKRNKNTSKNQNRDEDDGLSTRRQNSRRQAKADEPNKNHVKSTSIEGYDTSYPDDQSMKDLFFSAQPGVQMPNSRQPQMSTLMLGNTQSTHLGSRGAYQYQSQELHLQMNQDRLNKINQLKETLGSTNEDRLLLKHLAKFEASLLGRQSVQDTTSKSTTLAKKNLQRVYGKVKDKLSEVVSLHQPKGRNTSKKFENLSFFEEDNFSRIAGIPHAFGDTTSLNNRNKRPPPSASGMRDSRLKNLETIYLKNLNQERRTASQMQRVKTRTQNQSAWDLDFSSGDQNPTKFRPMMQHSLQDTGIESSDQEELRMRQQLDKMQAILDKGQKSKAKFSGTSVIPKNIPKGNKRVVDGGWL